MRAIAPGLPRRRRRGSSLGHGHTGFRACDPIGAFTTAGHRFAYNTSTGTLSCDRDGSGTGFAASTVAALAGNPLLSAGSTGDLFFMPLILASFIDVAPSVAPPSSTSGDALP